MALASAIAAPRRWLRSLYDWTMRWAESPWSVTALFLIALAESSFFPIPPDVLLIAIVAGATRRWFSGALVCTAGSLVGAMLGYYIGAALMATVGQSIIDFYNAQGPWDLVRTWYQSDSGMWFVLIAAFTPVPYKVATIAAGATGMPFVPFLLVSSIGRAGRFFLVAGLLRVFGPAIRAYIEKHFDMMALLFAALLIGGFLVLKLF
ncbi:MAG: VTT domain-containing protein [Vicinamibacterales bacterium]